MNNNEKKLKENKKRYWDEKDWRWLTAVLIGIIMIVLTSRLGDNLEVVNQFSFISSAVSIALALVAIYIALKQDSENHDVNKQTSNLLTAITTKIENVDNKIDRLDPNSFTSLPKSQLINEIQQIIDEKNGELDRQQLMKQINETVNKKFDVINNKINTHYNRNSERFKYRIEIEDKKDKVDDIDLFVNLIINNCNVVNFTANPLGHNNIVLSFYSPIEDITDFIFTFAKSCNVNVLSLSQTQ